jgi:hypothetical protein
MLKLASSSAIYLLGTQVACGSRVTDDQRAGFADSAACDLAGQLAQLQLDGAFVFDAAACKAIAVDWGHFVHRTPLGILKPASAGDIQKLLRFANQQAIPVVMRGTGGAAYGQTQTQGGIVIDSSTMKSMAWVDGVDDAVDLGPGCLWFDVVAFTNTKQKAPPVLPDTMYISVGGTLSGGGIGETSYREGAQVDNVIELDVVTALGDLVTCSPTSSPDLFHAALAGMGQVGIIVRARVRLIDSVSQVFTRVYRYPSAAADTYLADMSLFARTESQGAISGALTKGTDGTWTLVLTVTYWSSPTPDWLHQFHGTTDGTVKTWSFFDCLNRNSQPWPTPTTGSPHPYVACFLPKERAGAVVAAILASPTANLGASKIMLFPQITANFRQPLQKMPDSDETIHLRVYRIVSDGEGSANHQKMLDSNLNELLPLILQNGGKVYLPFCPLLSSEQLNAHYGDVLSTFLKAKYKYDPNSIVGMSAGIFGPVKAGPCMTT